MTLSDQALDALLKRLHLANTRRAWREADAACRAGRVELSRFSGVAGLRRNRAPAADPVRSPRATCPVSVSQDD